MAKNTNNQIFTDLSQIISKRKHNSVMNNKFCQRLKELRLSENLTQKELAIKLGKSRTTVYEWERNGHEPDYDTLIDIAEFFNVSLDYLLGNIDIKKISKISRFYVIFLIFLLLI